MKAMERGFAPRGGGEFRLLYAHDNGKEKQVNSGAGRGKDTQKHTVGQ